jgi:hypothetical protein
MTLARVSIGRLMLAVAVIGFHLAVVCCERPILGLDGLEVGLLPGVTVLAAVMFWGRGRRSRYGRALVVFLIAALALYLALCLTVPDLVRQPVVFYINEVEPRLYDADLLLVYRLSLEIQGLILGFPQLLLALAGAALLYHSDGGDSPCSP